MILQLEIVLLYAGIVKINPDWLRLQPLAMWLANRGDLPWLGPYLTQTWAAAIGAYGSIALHLIGAPLLLWKRTRFFVFVVYVVFHISNAVAFRIGIFPWITIAATLMFFEPDWPRRLWRSLKPGWPRPRARHDALAANCITKDGSAAAFPASTLSRRLVIGLLALFFVFQILVPLRHLAYPGDVAWTEEGHRFSWRMKLRSKDGTAQFHITDPASGRTWQVADVHLQRWQRRAMTCKPDMLLQYAHQLARTWESGRGIPDVEIRAEVWCSLNGRRPALLLDPERDLAKVDRTLRQADWILPLQEPPLHAGRASP